MSLLKYLNPNAIKDGSIEGVKIKDGSISSSKIASMSKSITWSELKMLRNSGRLVPGQQYRITDYQCTTTQEGTKSAGHQFDIIVTADSESVLNEEARAIKHIGDNYFNECDLNAWKIWYCIDNNATVGYNTPRFGWADETNGKGVIYRMIDEFGNDCPYDFKNIIYVVVPYFLYSNYNTYNYKFNRDTTLDMSIDGTQYYGYVSTYRPMNWSENKCWIKEENPSIDSILYKSDGSVISDGGNIFKVSLSTYETYTFGRETDFSKDAHCRKNTILPYRYSDGRWKLNNNTLGGYCNNNTFGFNCRENTLDERCENNFFGSGCYNNSFGDNCYNNSFGNDCYFNTFDHGFSCNTLGNSCEKNSFGYDCKSNNLGSFCSKNTLTPGCCYNTFGERSENNTVGNYCSYNYLGNYCKYNDLGRSQCSYNSFGNDCNYIKFAPDSSASTNYSYYQHNHFGDGCQYILFKGAETASDSSQVQNYNFAQGLQGTSSAYLTVDGVRNRSYETYISKDTNGVIKESVIAEKLDTMIEISYSELVALRDSSKLISGQQYRITDYTCTTIQANTRSAGHQFDIIVTADDENTLNEVARAIQHEGDTYFTNCDLNAWKIWYCLDNDTTRFAWADSANGKGVIYRMIDEFNNDVPYDFKNIQFYRQWNSNTSLWSTIPTDNTGVPCYTFSSEGDSSAIEFTDMTLMLDRQVYGNTIKAYALSNQVLNNNCFFGEGCNCNIFGYECQNNTLESSCNNNTFGNRCNDNTIKSGCQNNTFGSGCNCNIFGYECQNNTFGNDCTNNTFDNGCDHNTFGNICDNNTLGNSSWNNIFGNGCDNNILGSNSSSNSFGNICQNNTFENSCNNNTFGENCIKNTFVGNCSYNALGSGCQNIKFAPDSSAQMKNYYRNNHFGDGCTYIIFTGTETASSSAQVQNYNFAQGLKGTTNAYLTIDGKRNRAFETKVAQNSNGELKIYCEADLIK